MLELRRRPASMLSERPSCPACDSGSLEIFFEQPRVPVFCNMLHHTQRQAIETARGDLRLGYCRQCGMIHNTAFDPSLLRYTGDYENSLHFSPRFGHYVDALTRRMIRTHDLHGKVIVEIGCGKGDFLLSLCRLGGNRGIGFDPSYTGPEQIGGVRFVREYYGPDHAAVNADFICCRHVLEHIAQPRTYLESLRRSLGDRNVGIFCEVPNFQYTLRHGVIWDLIYEHCSHFTAGSLTNLFRTCGFQVTNVTSSFGNEYLGIEAAPGCGDIQPPLLGNTMRTFAARYEEKLAHWNRQLAEWLDRGEQVVLWGVGSKGVTFVNTVRGGERIAHIIDINPRKHGRFVPGTGQRIDAPASLCGKAPRVVLVMNPIYRAEIQQSLNMLGVKAQLFEV